jgi:NADPH2:quinone reductase
MKAVVVCEFGSASVEDWPDPRPTAGEVVVDVNYIEANYPDVLVIEGRYQHKPALPFIPGKSAVGRISALGDSVTQFAVGDRVALQIEHGAYAGKVCAPAVSCFPIPDGLDNRTAAALGLPYQTAWFALRDRANLEAGQSVLALGAAGGVGLATVQLAKAFGAHTVIGTTRGAQKAERVRTAGADLVVETTRPDLREALRDEVRTVTGGLGADVVVDPIGGEATEAALRALAWRGRLVIVGFAASSIPTIKANYLLVKNIMVAGLQWSDYRDRTPDLVARAQAEIFDLALKGRLEPSIDAVLALSGFANALDRIKTDKASGRILLSPSGGSLA